MSTASQIIYVLTNAAMPPNLRKAHQHLDKVADSAYAYPGPAEDAGRVAFLFALYTAIS